MAAQQQAISQFITGTGHKLVGAFEEVESGKRTNRPELHKAIALCRKHKAQLVIAKLDRLARNASFVLNLRDSGVDFVACDLPSANKLTIGIMALMAEQERDWISERTKAGLAQAKNRGTQLGNPRIASARKLAIQSTRRKARDFAHNLGPVIEEIQQAGVTTLKGIAKALNARGEKTALGGSWTRQAVARVQKRLSKHPLLLCASGQKAEITPANCSKSNLNGFRTPQGLAP